MSSLKQLQPFLRAHATELLRIAGPQAALTSVRRTRAIQAKLYRDYLAGRSQYPAAPPGHSAHEVGRAFDITAPPALLARLGQIWESWGGRWGGRFGDPIHFEG